MPSFDTMGFGPRFYREEMGKGRFCPFMVSYKDSDLWIGVDSDHFNPAMISFAREVLVDLRTGLEKYIQENALFATSLSPIEVAMPAPSIAIEMALSARLAQVGPMASVAGAFAGHIGEALLKNFPIEEIVVENGGDIFMKIQKDIFISVYAGNSALSGKFGIEIPASVATLGICTSAGKIGPSLSFGMANAVTVACRKCSLADAFATAFGNRVNTGDDIADVLDEMKKYPEILSAIIICDDKAGVYGQFPLKPITG
jgi:uncharacterized protein